MALSAGRFVRSMADFDFGAKTAIGVRCRTSLSETALQATCATKWIWHRRQDCSPPPAPVLIADFHRLGKRLGHSFLPSGHDVGVGVERGQDAGVPQPSWKRPSTTFCFCCRATLAWKCVEVPETVEIDVGRSSAFSQPRRCAELLGIVLTSDELFVQDRYARRRVFFAC